MSPVHSKAIADFLKNGGRVVKAQHTVPVTGDEVLDYLVSSGFRVKYSPRDSRYYYEGKQSNLTKLVALANTHRAARQLPPFAARVNINVGSRRA
jgi:hypothetical protein